MPVPDEALARHLADALSGAVITVPGDVVSALESALEAETGELARMHLGAILENIRLAAGRRLPVCEDTGMVSVIIEAGKDFPHLDRLLAALPRAIELATVDGPLRPNTVDPFTGRNHGNNLGPNMPLVSVYPGSGSGATVHLLPKGGGSEHLSALWMLNPADGLARVKRVVLEHVQQAGGRPCPPVILGIGIGGGADVCMALAKRSLLRELGSHNPDPNAAALETDILDAVNRLGVGPMGMGGRTTALAVHVEYAPRHPATFPVGLVMQCWCSRHASIRLDSDCRVMGP